jgi:beta-galactosidase
VSFDRKDQKDAYYLYRALWNKKSPTLYISEKRRNIRQDSVQTIKIYSSAKDAPVLTVNKEAVKINQTAPCQYVSDPVVMHGRNVVEVKAGELSDQQIITIRNALKQR